MIILEDKEIVALFFDRDERAIRESENKYGPHCLAVANGILHSEADSDECVNDTWLRLWNSIPPERPRSLKAYVSKITRNLALSKYQKRTADKRGGGEMAAVYEEVGEFIADTSSVETEQQRREFVLSLNRFLSSLSQRDKSVFLRRYYFSQSVKHIANVHSISEKNTLTILSRVRKKLKTHLGKEGYSV